ncbi:MAG TPA: ThiF family adenylyltransferase [Gemmataceae bacterium]|nr:ThiF family adenylyltransferase [Gemmataceae bacterium]
MSAALSINGTALARRPFVFIGAGAVGGPTTGLLANLGMRRCVLIDPKRYQLTSIATQCEPDEVGRLKVEAVAGRLRTMGVKATPLAVDVGAVEPGWVEDDAVIVVSADNRRADILANRLAAMMQAALVKVNIEPKYHWISVRAYDLRSDAPAVCLECPMTDAQYAAQRHPAGCEGDGERPTGSPRALCQAAAGVAALAAARLADGCPDWFGRQWDLNLAAGRATWCDLPANPDCRWEHGRRWRNRIRLDRDPTGVTPADLLKLAGRPSPSGVRWRLSARAALAVRCGGCGRDAPVLAWASRLSEPIGSCRCGGELLPVPFCTFEELRAADLDGWLDRPLADWGVPPRAILAVDTGDGEQQSFVVGA